MAKPRISVEDATIALYEYRSPGGVPVFVFWQCADGMKKTGGAAGVLGGGKYAPAYVRPGDSCETRPATFYVNGSSLDDPVWVDLSPFRTGFRVPEGATSCAFGRCVASARAGL